MEALVIFGIVCNVMQTIAFGHEAISTCKRYYRDGCADEDLRQAAGQMHDITKDLQGSIRRGGQPYTEDETKLLEVANSCSNVAGKLSEMLDGMKHTSSKGPKKLFTSVRLTVKRNMKKSTIEDLGKTLEMLQRTMEIQFIMRLCNQQSATELQRQENFLQLGERLRNFVNECANSYIKIEQLIGTQADSIKQHTSSEANKNRDLLNIQHQRSTEHTSSENEQTRNQLAQKMDDLKVSTLTISEREKLLKSLNFMGRDQRLNEVKEPYHRTFEWLFGDESHATDRSENEPSDDPSQRRSDSVDIVYEDILKESQAETWDSFSTWLQSTKKLYWIKGKPGAGKSTLMKFLYTDPRTIQLLAATSENILLSHFFWLAGSPMQCSIKGMLCSLLHQLLYHDLDGRWMLELFRQAPNLRQKETDTDWSEREAQHILETTVHLAVKSSQIYMFIDGLDEVKKSDGKLELLKLLEHLRYTCGVRMCVSSRPEEEFNRDVELLNASSLSLHKLTAVDMYQRVLDSLQSFADVIPVPFNETNYYSRTLESYSDLSGPQYLASKIVNMSQGVFLWADIVVRSLERGIKYHDTWSDLLKRLELLPRDLNQLYASMWARLGDDTKLYQEEASFYFNIMLEWNHQELGTNYMCSIPVHDKNLDERTTRCFCSPNSATTGITLYHLSLAKHLDRGVNYDLGTLDLDSVVIWDSCASLFKKLPILSAGLLELSGHSNQEIYRNPDINIDFIHRTAKDFLSTTAEGRAILQVDKSSFEDRFVRIMLAYISRRLAFRSSVMEGKGHLCVPLAKVRMMAVLIPIRRNISRIDEKTMLQLLNICQSFYDNSDVVAKRRIEVDFLGKAANYGLNQYVCNMFEPTRFTPSYKNYILCCAILHEWNVVDDTMPKLFSDWLALVDYLIPSECVPDLCFIDRFRAKKTQLGTFLGQLGKFFEDVVIAEDVVLCSSVIAIIRKLASDEAALRQPTYGFFNSGLLIDGYGTPMFGCYNSNVAKKSSCLILVEWSTLDLMSQVALTYSSSRNTYFCRQLQSLLTEMRPNHIVELPKIICVARSRFWWKRGMVVSSDEEIRILKIISQSIYRETDDRLRHALAIQRDLNNLVNSILDDGDVPEFSDDSDNSDDSYGPGNLTDLFIQLGFHKTWPMALTGWLQGEGFSDSLPQGEVYPPVKYLE